MLMHAEACDDDYATDGDDHDRDDTDYGDNKISLMHRSYRINIACRCM